MTLNGYVELSMGFFNHPNPEVSELPGRPSLSSTGCAEHLGQKPGCPPLTLAAAQNRSPGSHAGSHFQGSFSDT